VETFTKKNGKLLMKPSVPVTYFSNEVFCCPFFQQPTAASEASFSHEV